MQGQGTPQPQKKQVISIPPWVLLLGVGGMVFSPLLMAGWALQGCMSGKGKAQAHLDGLRGKPPSYTPQHDPETRAALAELSRATSVVVKMPDAMSSGWGYARWCTTGVMMVAGQSVPFGLKYAENDGVGQVTEMSLSRKRCVSVRRGSVLR